jgi:hypothetical protein
MKKTLLAALIVTLLLALLVFYGCGSQQETMVSEGFAIYLTKNDIPVSQMEALSYIEIADEPVISIDDIISYDGDTHEIELTTGAYERVMGLQVPTSGKSFIVCVDKQSIYWGAFWTPISSQSFNGVTVQVLQHPQEGNVIKLELGYPSPSFYQGDDPRSNYVIMQSLEQAGKLK